MVYPVEPKVDFLPGGGSGGPKNDGAQAQRVVTKRMKTSSVNQRIASTSTTASFSLPQASDEMIGSELPMEQGSLGGGKVGQSAIKGMVTGTCEKLVHEDGIEPPTNPV